jgi:hypothetical protein
MKQKAKSNPPQATNDVGITPSSHGPWTISRAIENCPAIGRLTANMRVAARCDGR